MTESAPRLRPMTDDDRFEVADLIYASINVWYGRRGMADIFNGGPEVTEIFYDVYNALTPGCNVVAEHPRTARLMGSCFYHPRERHVSLGIMTVHPNYYGRGVGGQLLRHIIDYTESHGYNALRLTQSAMNLDSFSLYNRYGFVPRYAYQDMYIDVPETGFHESTPLDDRVRDATLADVPAMAALESEVAGITREPDYRYCIENALGLWSVRVFETPRGDVDGFMISCGHTAMNMLGPCVARGEPEAAALLRHALNTYPGRSPVFLVPMEKESLVRQMYDWGARNCELHLCQVRGEFQPFRGVNMPSFLPETG